ncbi:MAG TPA: RNA polymerase sigma factor [Acidobacteriaceae bacterium]|nr:RNA polymerase sigma factor [Acidobacteriaceae bacterium]
MSPTSAQFADALHRHQGRVYSIALRILGESGAAEEVAQDVFLELHRSLPRLKGEQHITAWLRRVTCHRATDALRRRAVRGGTAQSEWDENFLPESAPVSPAPLMNRIERLLFSLSPQQRTVIVLRYQEDMEPEDIAIELEMPLATVRSHLQRGLQLLRSKAERTLKEYIRG